MLKSNDNINSTFIIYLCYLHYYLLLTTQTDISAGALKSSNVGQDTTLKLPSKETDGQTITNRVISVSPSGRTKIRTKGGNLTVVGAEMLRERYERIHQQDTAHHTPVVSNHPKPLHQRPKTHSIVIPPMANKPVLTTKHSISKIVLQTKQMDLQASWICITCGKKILQWGRHAQSLVENYEIGSAVPTRRKDNHQ